MATTDEFLEALMNECRKPDDFIGENSRLQQLTRMYLAGTVPVEKIESQDRPQQRAGNGMR